MIYFENYQKGLSGFNNHLIPYVFCISLSNFLDRDFYFDYEVPCVAPPVFAVTGKLKEKFKILIESERSNVSDMVEIPNRRRFEIDRQIENKITIPNPAATFISDRAFLERFGDTPIMNFFSLGRGQIIKEELQNFELIEFGDRTLVNATYYYFLSKVLKNDLLASSRIRYSNDLELLADKITLEIGRYNAIHLRLGDFLTSYLTDGYEIQTEKFRKCIQAAFTDDDRPIVIATDGLEEKELFKILIPEKKYIFLDELIFADFESEYSQLKFTDFNALSVINQIVCANAELFVGTCRSTFTSIIHRLRQERWSKKDFNFFPDKRIEKITNAEFRIEPDQQGFFDWNRFSVFNEYYEYPCWMREWDFDLTSLP